MLNDTNKNYQDPNAASRYREFSASEDGQMQHELIKSSLQSFLPPDPELAILDAGCGTGWLAYELSSRYKNVQGIDLSSELIKNAQKNYPGLNFQIADLALNLPFKEQSFDIIILNMVLHNIKDQVRAFNNLAKLLRPQGKVLVTSVNSYYGFPVAMWKRSWWEILLGLKPRLKLRAYNRLADKNRDFIWNKTIPARFSPLPEQINNAIAAGLVLEYINDLKVDKDSDKFNFQYRLFRFPLITLMVFRK